MTDNPRTAAAVFALAVVPLLLTACDASPKAQTPAEPRRMPPKIDVATIERPRDYVADPMVDPSEVDNGPKRIVSVAPSLTELCCAFGMKDRLVGRTQYCVYPPGIESVPVLGAYTDLNLEAVVAANPDVVLITESSPKIRDDLEALKLKVAALPDSTYDDVLSAIDEFGRLVGRPKTAAALHRALRADIDRLSVGEVYDERVLFLTQKMAIPPKAVYIAGPGSVLDQFITRCGRRNALVGHHDKEWGQIPIEMIIASQPDVIIEISDDGGPEREKAIQEGWSVLASVPAYDNGRIRSLPEWILIPSPRINLIMYHLLVTMSQ